LPAEELEYRQGERDIERLLHDGVRIRRRRRGEFDRFLEHPNARLRELARRILAAQPRWMRESERSSGMAEERDGDGDEFEEAPGEDEPWAEPELSWEEEVAEQDRMMLRRQEEFRAAADYVAAAFAGIPAVARVALFGSVARPLRKEVPRFKRFRRAGVAVWHECKDVDLAVWLPDLGDLKALQKARGRALNALFAETGIGVAHHQVDVFLLEPGSDRYRGRLCHFGTCPKGKPACQVPGCGAALFLQQHEGFVFDPLSLDPARCTVLFDRARSLGPPPLDRWMDDVPF
jgi:hypothetical protein